jgi:hypothetical protein
MGVLTSDGPRVFVCFSQMRVVTVMGDAEVGAQRRGFGFGGRAFHIFQAVVVFSLYCKGIGWPRVV